VDTGGLGYRDTVAAYIVGGQRYAAIIDTGYSSTVSRLLGAAERLGLAEKIRYIIPTHAHLDHCGAAGDLVSVIRGAEVYAHERALPHLVNPSRLLESVMAFYDPPTFSAMGGTRPVCSERARVLRDGDEIELGGLTIRAFYTHGHANHHLSIHLVEKGYVVTGDAVPSKYPFAEYFIPNTAPPRFDLDEALRSLEKIFRLEPRLLLTPHYGPLLPSQTLYQRYVTVITEAVELARAMSSRGGGVAELEARLGERITGFPRLAELHPVARMAVKLAAISLSQTYRSST